MCTLGLVASLMLHRASATKVQMPVGSCAAPSRALRPHAMAFSSVWSGMLEGCLDHPLIHLGDNLRPLGRNAIP